MSRTADEQDVFRAVADLSRRTILDALAEGPKTFQELHAALPVSKPAVSQHLAILVAAGLASVRRDADRRSTYALVPEPLLEIDDWIAQYRSFWTVHLEGLGAAMRRHRAAKAAAQDQRPAPRTRG
jgi:DNA-binding transcriptional ArsR family regulator